MILALHVMDWGLIGLFLLVVLAVGIYFAGQQRTITDFAVGGRSLWGILAGVSMAVTVLAAYQFVGVPSEAYSVGLMWLLAPIGLCLAAIIVVGLVLPLFSKLDITSIYEYLEMRFGPGCRWLAAGLWVIWRFVWLMVVLGVPCHFLAHACGGAVPAWAWILIVGVIAAVPASLGGLKAVVWTDVFQAVAMIGALVVLVGAILWNVDGGGETVWRIAKEFGRAPESMKANISILRFSWTDSWAASNVVLFFMVLMLVLSVADQTVLQRLLGAKNLGHCRRGYLAGVVFLALLLGALTYVGIGLFAFYHENPNSLRPMWVVNLNNETHQSLTVADANALGIKLDELESESGGDAESETDDGGKPGADAESTDAVDETRPLVEWNTDLRDMATLEKLVADKRILQPNSRLPFEKVEDLLRLDTNELDVQRLAMVRPDGELLLNTRAAQELLPHFVSQRLGMGLLGLVLMGVLAASMASFDSGLHSLGTVLLVDFHRRGGVGRNWLATRLGKSVNQVTESDELKVARPLTAVVGVVVIVLALLLGSGDNILWLLHTVTVVVGANLLAVFLLGILTRSATGAGAITGLLTGILLSSWIVFGPALADTSGALAWLWPWKPLAANWAMIFGAGSAMVVGFAVSFGVGRRRSKQELRGLVCGIGNLGERDFVHEAISVPGGGSPPADESRWR